MKKTFRIKTFGCQMNWSDSERVTGFLESIGWQKCELDEDADLIIFNTCSVRQKAEDKVIGLMYNLGKLKKKNPRLRVAITGCMVRKTGLRRDLLVSEREDLISADTLFEFIPNVDLVFRIEDVHKLGDHMNEMYPIEGKCDKGKTDMQSYFNIQPKYNSKAQILVPIMAGCNHFCSYCIVPFTRGREWSRPLQEIVSEIENAVRSGVKEVTLLGQNVNSYQLEKDYNRSTQLGEKKKSDFVILLEEIDKIPGLSRIRYTSSHPRDFDDDLIMAHKELKGLCNYVHLPVQSGDNEVLSRMKREYEIETYIKKMKKLQREIPDIALSTDIIVGFCGETEEQFQNTLKLVREIEFDLIYLAQYSPRKGTFSEKMYEDDVAHGDKHRRWHELNELLKGIVLRKNQKYVGKTVEVLVEENHKGYYIGKARDWKTVRFSSNNENLVGEEVYVKIEDAKTWILEGKMVEKKVGVSKKEQAAYA